MRGTGSQILLVPPARTCYPTWTASRTGARVCESPLYRRYSPWTEKVALAYTGTAVAADNGTADIEAAAAAAGTEMTEAGKGSEHARVLMRVMPPEPGGRKRLHRCRKLILEAWQEYDVGAAVHLQRWPVQPVELLGMQSGWAFSLAARQSLGWHWSA